MRTLGYAIWVCYRGRTFSGYDLKQWMEGRWGISGVRGTARSTLSLARLEEGGYVTHSVVEQRERPDKKVYRITAEGLEALKEWVIRPPVPRSVRDELTLKAYSVWLADKEKAVRLFREEGLQARGAARALRGAEDLDGGEHVAEDLSPRLAPWFAAYATLRRGIGYEREYAEWCRWMADSVERRGPSGEAEEERERRLIPGGALPVESGRI